MSTYPEPPVVVGVDGTAASTAALDWAAAEARAHHAPLLVVHILDPRQRNAVYSPAPAGERDPGRILARIRALVDRAGAERVEQVYEIGVPGLALAQRARGARLLVLGQARAHHRTPDEEYPHVPALGPVARACVAGADCPVVVVPEQAVGRTASTREQPRHRDPVHGARAIYPFQGRIPVAHH